MFPRGPARSFDGMMQCLRPEVHGTREVLHKTRAVSVASWIFCSGRPAGGGGKKNGGGFFHLRKRTQFPFAWVPQWRRAALVGK